MYILKKQPVQERAKATVNAILEAAVQVLLTVGYSGATTNRIAARAGVSIGSLYEYFAGKEAVFAEVCRREYSRWYTALVSVPVPDSPQGVLRHLVGSRIRLARDNLELVTVLEQEIPATALQALDQFIYSDFLQVSVEYLRQHPQLRPQLDRTFLAELLMRTVSATVQVYAIKSPATLHDPRLEDEIVAMLQAYLLPASVQ